MKQNRVYVGYDERQERAYRVCCESVRAWSSIEPLITPISSQLLGGLYTRPDTRREGGMMWDSISGHPMSTQFSIARFYAPLLARDGWALFCDCDFLWRDDVERLFDLADERYAVMVVKQEHVPRETVKMDGQVQRQYFRKNWSSLMLFNCTSPEVRSLTASALNVATGSALHEFAWVSDERIGSLPLKWNWLAGVSAPDADPSAVHFTLGTPDMPGYESAPFADEWRAYAVG